MNDTEHRNEIVRLEAEIDGLIDRIESWAGRIAVTVGGTVLIAILVDAIQFNPSLIASWVAAVLGGIVAAGSNRSTAQEAAHALTAAEAKRTALIEQIDLRIVPDPDDNH